MISALSEEREKFLSCHERESISQESHEKAGPQTKARLGLNNNNFIDILKN